MGPVSPHRTLIERPRFAARGASWFTAYPMGQARTQRLFTQSACATISDPARFFAQDWWSADDYKAFNTQLVKLKMNFIATHTYSVEPTVWVGSAGNLTAAGRIKGGVYNTTPWFRASCSKVRQAGAHTDSG